MGKAAIRIWLGALACSLSMSASADILDGNAGTDSFRASMYGALPELFEVPTGQYDVGFVIRPERDKDLLQVYLGALLTSEYTVSDYDFAAGVGLRGIYVGQDHDSGGALALGGMAEFPIPQLPDFGVSGYAYFAPEVLGLGDIGKYLEYAASVDYKFSDKIAVYLGYRYIKYDIAARNGLVADDGGHVGIRLHF